MKSFFHSRGFRLLAAAAALLCAAMIYTAALGEGGLSSATSSVVGLFTTPMQWLASIGGERLSNLTADVRKVQEMEQEIDELRRELDERNRQLSDYYEIKKQNDDLKEYLDIKDVHQDWAFVPATIVGRDTNELFSGFTVNKGAVSGVRAGDPVITESGLVGRVSKVGTTYAKVETIYHPDVQVSVISSRTEEIGVLCGDKIYADQNLVQMQYLNPKTSVQAGDLIVTSGKGGVYPQKIIIGTVQQVIQSRTDISLTALVRPAVDLDSITSVMIITSFTGQGETMESLDGNEE